MRTHLFLLRSNKSVSSHNCARYWENFGALILIIFLIKLINSEDASESKRYLNKIE